MSADQRVFGESSGPGAPVPAGTSVAEAVEALVTAQWADSAQPWAEQGRAVVWRDLGWRVRKDARRDPVMVLEPVLDGGPAGSSVDVPVAPGALLGLVVAAGPQPGAGRWCAGFARAVLEEAGPARFMGVPCPERTSIRRGQQCASCAARDEFRAVHRVHRGGRLSPAAAAYSDAPHWLYVATFPDGSAKVGTAHQRSKVRRLDQQAVAAATYVALAPDGAVVRELEDAVTQVLGLPQAKRVSSKYAAWCDPLPGAVLAQLHADAVQQIQEYVRSLEDPLAWEPVRHEVLEEHWRPALPMHRAYEALAARSPRPLAAAEGFGQAAEGHWLIGAVGPFLTAHAGNPDAAVLLNTAPLKNCGVLLTQDPPVQRAAQASLF